MSSTSSFFDLDVGGRNVILLPTTTITTAVTGTVTTGIGQLIAPTYLGLQAIFTYGSGGTTAKFWIQTSFDRGVTWCDIVNFAFTTATATKIASVNGFPAAGVTPVAPTDGTLADNTLNNGLFGTHWRVKYTTTGTYAGGTTIQIFGNLRG